MRRSILTPMTLCLGFLVCIATNPAGAADKKATESQLNGTVHMMNKDKSTITVHKGTLERQIVYNGDTKWMYGRQAGAKPSSLDQLKEGWYINCKGTFDGAKLVASACRFRESK
jgi:hypothetical protein